MFEPVGTSDEEQEPVAPDRVTVHSGWASPGVVATTVPVGVRPFALDVTPLRRNPAYRRLWFGQGISFIGTEIAEVALAYQMYQLTGSTLAVGLISLTHLVPLLTLTVIGGALADAFDRRRVMLVQQVGMVAGSLGLAANAALSHPRVWTPHSIPRATGSPSSLKTGAGGW